MGNEFISKIKTFYKFNILSCSKILNHNILMKTKKRINKFNFTRKKAISNPLIKKSGYLQDINHLQPINQFHKNIYIKNQKSTVKTNIIFKEDFLSSCFKYYYGKIQICINENNNINNKSKSIESSKSCQNISLTKSFLQVKSKGALVIIDYPNIIHILYEHYKNKNKVIHYFYEFIYTQLKKNTKFYIISKKVIIDDVNFDIDTVFNEGAHLTGKIINEKYFTNEHINIYDLNYKIKLSSSIDDLLGYFICFVLFVYLSKSGINPNENQDSYSSLHKLNIITNDKQFFNKNLFGLTEDEQKHHIEIMKDLRVNKLTLHNNKYEFTYNNLDGELIRSFLNEYITTTAKDNKNLECKMLILFEIHNNSINKMNSYESQDIFSYDNLNTIQKKYLNNYYNKCKGLNTIVTKEKDLIHYYYLYFFIKYVQMYLHGSGSNNNNNISISNNNIFNLNKNKKYFYSSFSKEEIITLFLNK